jgi:peptidoglycan/LPS O-acetylase OafA/YrhL
MSDQQGKEENERRFVVLDGLRGAAAFAVVTVHAHSPTWKALLSHAPLAVDFFFMLSGFVIAHVYADRLRKGLSVSRFMLIRWVRFWPMLLAAFVLVVIGHLLMAIMWGRFVWPLGHYLASIALGLAFLPVPPSLSLDFRSGFPVVGPAYTMFLELSVNLVFALVAARLTRSLHIAIVVLLGGLLIWAASVYDTIILGWPWYGFIGALPRVGFSFFAGALFYRLWRQWRLPSVPAWLSFVALIAVFMIPANGAWYELVSVFVVFPALVLFSAAARVTGHFERVCMSIGTYSYGFYILHQPVIRYVEMTLSTLGVPPETVDIWLLVWVVAVTGSLAVILTHFYERPFRNFLGRLVGLRPATTLQGVPEQLRSGQ